MEKNVTLRGSIAGREFGRLSIILFPDNDSPGVFKPINSPELAEVIIDHFRLLQSPSSSGIVHGKRVNVLSSMKSGAKYLSFQVGFMKITLLEDKKSNGNRALFFIELPFGYQTDEGDQTIYSAEDIS